ncbi:MAG: hypothetical protein LBB23_02850 [Rickettsiales bacterium]|nr:hypothetical protein [Rickettsiales bacterium]
MSSATNKIKATLFYPSGGSETWEMTEAKFFDLTEKLSQMHFQDKAIYHISVSGNGNNCAINITGGDWCGDRWQEPYVADSARCNKDCLDCVDDRVSRDMNKIYQACCRTAGWPQKRNR